MKKIIPLLSGVLAAVLMTGCPTPNNSVPEIPAPLTAFYFTEKGNKALRADVTGTVSEKTIALTVPYKTDVTALVATFSAATGVGVSIGSIPQASGLTGNDFTRPVTYTVTNEGGLTRYYTITVTISSTDANALTAFSFKAGANTTLGIDVTGSINEKTIALTVPYGTNVTELVPTFSTPWHHVAIGRIPQVSGKTKNDFTKPVTYTVTTDDGLTREYIVVVTIASASAKELTAFSFKAGANTTLGIDVTGIMTKRTIELIVPYGTNVAELVPTFTTTGKSVSIGGKEQTSGETSCDFSNPQTCTVTAEDGTIQNYGITVTIAEASAKEDSRFNKASKPGDFAGITITLTTSSSTQKMIYANNQASLTFPTGVEDTETATLTHQFWMGETEVTNELFAAVYQWAFNNGKFNTTTGGPNILDDETAKHGKRELVDLDNPACRVEYDGSRTFSAESRYKNHPVTNVSWYGAIMFCNWLTEMRDGNTDNVVYSGMNDDWDHTRTIEDKSKNGYRLPSSNEWEYTARYRGTNEVNVVDKIINSRNFKKMKLKWTKGDSASDATANISNVQATKKVAVYGKNDEAAVKSKTVNTTGNTLGLYDMSGNVWEWCFTKSDGGTLRVNRGGSWKDKAIYQQVGNLINDIPSTGYENVGFRLCRTAE